MEDIGTVLLKRDCKAVKIPAGTELVLREGAEVTVTQSLGGTFTVHAFGGLYRINGADADALGASIPAEPESPVAKSMEEKVDEKAVWEVLKTCFDPEIPVNIVDLGLIYDLSIDRTEEGRNRVQVKMTLTAQGCGMGPVIAGDAREKILALDGVGEADVVIVWDPPWHQSMITASGREVLGL